MSHTPRNNKIEETPNRLAHLRKIAERIKLDQLEIGPMIRSVMQKCRKAVTA